MSKVSDVKVPSTARSLGVFKVGVFNLFDTGERTAYEELRTKGNDRASGVSIEHVQQFTRVASETESAGEGQTTTRKEDLYVLVQYWEKPLASVGKVTELATKDPPRDWYLEREPSKP